MKNKPPLPGVYTRNICRNNGTFRTLPPNTNKQKTTTHRNWSPVKSNWNWTFWMHTQIHVRANEMELIIIILTILAIQIMFVAHAATSRYMCERKGRRWCEIVKCPSKWSVNKYVRSWCANLLRAHLCSHRLLTQTHACYIFIILPYYC